MKNKDFPRKEIYVYTSKEPIPSKNVIALQDRELNLTNDFKKYAEEKWEKENEGWTSSVLPSTVEVKCDEKLMTIHCGLTEYKYLLGMVKLANETGEMPLPENYIGGCSTEIMPLTSDGVFVLEQRISGTQHAVNYWDIPTASQNVQMWIDKIPKEHSGLVKSMFDMEGFPRWNLMRKAGVKLEEIGDIFYTGFSKGNEVSLDMQYNGFASLNVSSDILKERLSDKGDSVLFYQFSNLPEIINSIGGTAKKDIYENAPKEKFKIVDDCIGTLVSNAYHLGEERMYGNILSKLKDKGYKINLILEGKIKTKDLC